MTDFFIKQNDTSPALAVTLQDDDGNAIDLTGASVDFHMSPLDDSTLMVDSAATIADASAGEVKYEWSSGDTDTVQRYEAEFEVTYADGTIETFPNSENIIIRVEEELG